MVTEPGPTSPITPLPGAESPIELNSWSILCRRQKPKRIVFQGIMPDDRVLDRVNLEPLAKSRPLDSRMLRARHAIQHVCAQGRGSVRRTCVLRVQQERNVRARTSSRAEQ